MIYCKWAQSCMCCDAQRSPQHKIHSWWPTPSMLNLKVAWLKQMNKRIFVRLFQHVCQIAVKTFITFKRNGWTRMLGQRTRATCIYAILDMPGHVPRGFWICCSRAWLNNIFQVRLFNFQSNASHFLQPHCVAFRAMVSSVPSLWATTHMLG